MDIRLIFLSRPVISKECAEEEDAYIMLWKRIRPRAEARIQIDRREKLVLILYLSPVP
tara:strand:- start:164 stop:337 length:174 start_codon:yes stop_codon:yes gene_type:complete